MRIARVFPRRTSMTPTDDLAFVDCPTPMMATQIVEPKGLWVGSTSARRDPTIKQKYDLHSNRNPKRRAKTFQGIAKAMEEQWAGKCEEVMR